MAAVGFFVEAAEQRDGLLEPSRLCVELGASREE